MSYNNWVGGPITIQCYVMRTYQVTIYRKLQNEFRARFRHWYLVPKAGRPLKPLLYLARPEGFEPPTLWFVAKHSIQLSYGRFGLWRRERDSNPRWNFVPYSLSRGAPSTTRPSLRTTKTLNVGSTMNAS